VARPVVRRVVQLVARRAVQLAVRRVARLAVQLVARRAVQLAARPAVPRARLAPKSLTEYCKYLNEIETNEHPPRSTRGGCFLLRLPTRNDRGDHRHSKRAPFEIDVDGFFGEEENVLHLVPLAR
jgi:hypothetical protein